jgi:hypothetical protein
LDSPFFETISNSGTDTEDDRGNGDVHASSDEEMVIVEIPGKKLTLVKSWSGLTQGSTGFETMAKVTICSRTKDPVLTRIF